MSTKRIFVSYKRNTDLDQPLAERLVLGLRAAGHEVFIDQSMVVGEDWVRRIQAELAAADHLLLLLSAHSIESQMVIKEVRMARAEQERSGG